ncbi:UDP-glycosyltransferase 76F1-like [Pyrus ussuriensis x Pyrus communis]|uniref:UDP-glycosyltransferase 76F1-like n=1 Tax=Pyrus ussuriensis x Pyrus communis TaxID=2448454 RepID=A0A5N5HLC0_9ROSA|nr:UDP-glycosyltransferase 76F1-like [Pyrus ussuriensis x Pyrus communis]
MTTHNWSNISVEVKEALTAELSISTAPFDQIKIWVDLIGDVDPTTKFGPLCAWKLGLQQYHEGCSGANAEAEDHSRFDVLDGFVNDELLETLWGEMRDREEEAVGEVEREVGRGLQRGEREGRGFGYKFQYQPGRPGYGEIR